MTRAIIKFILWSASALLAVVVLCCAFVLYHPRGVDLTANLINKSNIACVHIGQTEGRLGRHFRLEDLEVTAGYRTIVAKNFSINWEPHRIFMGKAVINDIKIDGLHISSERSEGSNKRVTLTLPSRFIDVKRLSIQDFTWRTPKKVMIFNKLDIKGHRTTSAWYVEDYTINAPTGQFKGSALIQDDGTVVIDVDALHVNPFEGRPEWDADINFKGRVFRDANTLDITVGELEGSWMDKALSGKFRGRQSHTESKWEGYVDLNDTHLSTRGTLTDTPDIDWVIYAPNMGNIIPNAKGHFFSEGHLGASKVTGNLDVNEFRWGKTTLTDIRGHLQGTLDEYIFELTGGLNDDLIDLGYTGQNLLEGITGTLNRASVDTMALESPVDMIFRSDEQKISRACFSNADRQLCTDWESTQNDWAFNLTATDFSLAALDPFLPASLSSVGNANIDVALEKTATTTLTGHIQSSVIQGEWVWSDAQGRRYDFPIEKISVDVDGTDEVFGQIKVTMSDSNTIDGQIKLNLGAESKNWKKVPIEGLVTVMATDLDAIEFIAPSIEVLNGSMMATLTIEGTLGAPELVNTDALLTNVEIPMVESNNTIFLNSLSLTGRTQEEIAILGAGTLGGGPFEVRGVMGLLDRRPKLSLHLTGQQMLFLDTNEYWITASPRLHYATTPDGNSILSGSVTIDNATIVLNEKASTRRLSDDVNIINHEAEPDTVCHSKGGAFETHINIHIPTPVPFTGYGLTATFDGDIRVDSTAGEPTKADGRLSLKDGEYRAFGKVFKVQTGDIFYSGGPIRNPIVDIRADREITVKKQVEEASEDSPGFRQPATDENILVGLALKGPLRQPSLSFYSEPSMNDGDIVSYLFIGRAQDQAEGAQAEVLFQALSELAPFSDSATLGERFGLDELGLTRLTDMDAYSDSFLENTALVIGKQLSSRLYIRYLRGLSNTIDTVVSDFQLRLSLGSHFTLEGNANGTGYGGDLLFSFDTE